jgi:hypothetical protein
MSYFRGSLSMKKVLDRKNKFGKTGDQADYQQK